MTDLEMTKLCADAMGVEIRIHDPTDAHEIAWIYRLPDDAFDGPGSKWEVYDPLHDDTQAMALVKKFKLRIGINGHGEQWQCHIGNYHEKGSKYFLSPDLNRAIIECVAHMQAAKASPQ